MIVDAPKLVFRYFEIELKRFVGESDLLGIVNILAHEGTLMYAVKLAEEGSA